MSLNTAKGSYRKGTLAVAPRTQVESGLGCSELLSKRLLLTVPGSWLQVEVWNTQPGVSDPQCTPDPLPAPGSWENFLPGNQRFLK